jgi:putative peptide zinc metalloprotease protein
MKQPTPASDLERRKQVKVRLRGDLVIAPHKYEGRTYYVVKDPVSLRYYRFKEHEHFVIQHMDGSTSLDEAQKEFEKHYRPERMKLEDLEAFAQQLINAGLAQNESPQAGKQLFDQRRKRRRNEWLQTLTNILYIKIPLFDPDRVLTKMVPYTRWIFTIPFLLVSVAVMLAAVLWVATDFDAFTDKLPYTGNFFTFRNFASFAAQNLAYMWIGLAVVKVIHEFGHGLSCKTFGGEVHEMGLLFLVLSPAMYCNVSDAWTLPNKWQRIIISAAGIYVELIIASIATFVWWYTPTHPTFYGIDINNLALSLMVLCSISTVLFNANPLMRYDGYYVLADWLEIPNLRDRSNRYLKNLFLEYCLGVEVQPEPYMELSRKILFVTYAIVSYVYRIWVTYYIILFLYSFLEPYRLQVVSEMLAWAAAGSLVGWPLFRLCKNIHKRGRLPDMKPMRVTITSSVVAVLVLFFFLVPLPFSSRVTQTGAIQLLPDANQPDEAAQVFVPMQAILVELGPRTRDGQRVDKDEVLAVFRSPKLEEQLQQAEGDYRQREIAINADRAQLNERLEPEDRTVTQQRLATAQGERDIFRQQIINLKSNMEKLTLRAPRDGIVISPPLPDRVGMLWENEQNKPFCTIGDPSKLRVVVPVSPSEYRLLKRDRDKFMKEGKDLEVTIRIHGRETNTWKGKIIQLPEMAAQTVPASLSTKSGGPVAVKQQSSGRQDQFEPLSQQYLIYIEILNPDTAICPGLLAQVKIHCRYRTCAWWAWHSISETFTLGRELPFQETD